MSTEAPIVKKSATDLLLFIIWLGIATYKITITVQNLLSTCMCYYICCLRSHVGQSHACHYYIHASQVCGLPDCHVGGNNRLLPKLRSAAAQVKIFHD